MITADIVKAILAIVFGLFIFILYKRRSSKNSSKDLKLVDPDHPSSIAGSFGISSSNRETLTELAQDMVATVVMEDRTFNSVLQEAWTELRDQPLLMKIYLAILFHWMYQLYSTDSGTLLKWRVKLITHVAEQRGVKMPIQTSTMLEDLAGTLGRSYEDAQNIEQSRQTIMFDPRGKTREEMKKELQEKFNVEMEAILDRVEALQKEDNNPPAEEKPEKGPEDTWLRKV